MEGIYRGSTPLFRVNIGFDPNLLDGMDFSIRQRGGVLIHKDAEDLDIDGNFVQYRLTQEETFMLAAKCNAEAQFRGRRLSDDNVVLTAVRPFAVYDSVSERVV